MSITIPVSAALICGNPPKPYGGGWFYNHDFDFTRMRLAQALYEAGNIRADCYKNYDDGESIEKADMLVTFTSQVPVSEDNCRALRRFLEKGGRWFAIHSSNSVLDNPYLPGIIGSKFLAHPPYQHYEVTVAKKDDALLEGIDQKFEVDDELYVIEHAADIEVLLETSWGGEAMGRKVPEGVRPLMYRRPVGDGGVLYLALGHANRPFDKPRPDAEDRPDQHGPWELPVYKELIRRGIEWAAGRRPLQG